MTVTHRMSKGPTYKSWLKMKERCTNPNSAQWRWYGGRGVKICERWLRSFENFLADMGQRPAGKTLDRYPDPDGNYEPSNCRWATHSQQIDNQKKTIWVEVGGEKITLREACRRTGVNYHTAYGRLQQGYDLTQALTVGDHRSHDPHGRWASGRWAHR